MSYAVAQPGRKPRPAVVSAASALLYVTAALLVVSSVLGFIQVEPVRNAVNDFYADRPEQQAVATGSVIGIIAAAAVSVLLAVGFVVLGLLVGRGKQAARVTTWVVAGLGVLCLGCGTASNALSSSLNLNAGQPDAAELQRRIEQAVPGWATAVSTTLDIVSLVILVAVIILLALPASNDFFRKEQEVWVPPSWPGGPTGGMPPGPPTSPYPPTPPYPPMPPAPPAYPPPAPPAYPPPAPPAPPYQPPYPPNPPEPPYGSQ